VRVRFQANHELGATRWLLQFGAAAQVLAPERLRNAVGAQLRAAAAQYPDS
jgi:predicted DNA-binding transcriptional regulator YafY